jgi:hypothetical protein
MAKIYAMPSASRMPASIGLSPLKKVEVSGKKPSGSVWCYNACQAGNNTVI